MVWWIAQFFSLVAILLFLYQITEKSTKRLFELVTWQCIFNVIKNILLQAYSGATTQFLAAIRSYLKSKDKFNLKVGSLIIVLQIIIGIFVNVQGLAGLLPVIASVGYSVVLIKTNNIYIIKYSLIANQLLWGIYYFISKDVLGVIINISYSVYVFVVTTYQLFDDISKRKSDN